MEGLWDLDKALHSILPHRQIPHSPPALAAVSQLADSVSCGFRPRSGVPAVSLFAPSVSCGFPMSRQR